VTWNRLRLHRLHSVAGAERSLASSLAGAIFGSDQESLGNDEMRKSPMAGCALAGLFAHGHVSPLWMQQA
jgi:hypothetical protein